MTLLPSPAELFTFALAVDAGDGDAAFAIAEHAGLADKPTTMLLGMIGLLRSIGTYYGRGIVVTPEPTDNPFELLTSDIIEAVLSADPEHEQPVQAGARVIQTAIASRLFADVDARSAWLADACRVVSRLLLDAYTGKLVALTVGVAPDDARSI